MDALISSPEAVQIFLEVTSDVLCIADAEGTFRAVSTSMSALLGWTEEEFRTRPFLSFVHPLDVPETLAAYKALLATGRLSGLVNRYSCRDGGYRWLSWRALLHAGRVYAAATDVTALRAQAEVLHEEQTRFRAAFEQAAIGKAIVGADGAWIEVNGALCAMLGYTPAELRVRTFQDVTHPDDLDADLALVGQVYRGEISSYQLEKRYLARDGQVVWVLLSVTAVRTPEGAFQYFLSEIQNISEAKAAQALAEQHRVALEAANAALADARNAAQAADRAKGAFLAILSHELRAPLNALTALSAQLRAGDTAVDIADRIAEETRRLGVLMEEALDFSHLEARTVTLHEQPVDLRALLGALVDAVRAHEAGGKVALTVRVDDAVPARVRGDAHRLQQMVGYLLENALQATPRGAIEVGALARPADDGAAVELHLTVSDTGDGYTPARLASLLAEGASDDRPDAPDETALRVALVRRLAALMGGRVWADSLSGAGSTFHVALRLGVVATQVRRPAATLPGGLRVLIVDDAPHARKLAQSILRREGLTADEATNGREAVAQAMAAAEAGQPYHVVLMDVMMPEMNGLEATRQLRDRLPAAAQPRIVAVTADALAGDLEHCKRAGMDLYVTKPYTPRRLLKALAQAAEGVG